MLQLLAAAVFVAFSVRYAGRSGARRYGDLPDDRARQQHEVHSSRSFAWLILFGIAAATVDAVLAVFFGSWRDVTVSLGAAALWLLALVLDRSARSNVVAGFAERGLEPMQRREASARRGRRQKQLAAVALGGYLSFQVLAVVGEESDATWLGVPTALAMILAAGGALALVWSMAWRFGDERPA